MIESVINISRKAGERIWQLYEAESIEVETKPDDSPVTQADLEANKVIMSGLKSLSSYPIVSEEALPECQERLSWETYWLVDPLDGTKGFLKRTGDFTVNIALIQNQKPVFGVIYVPKTGDVYSAQQGKGAFKNSSSMSNDRVGHPSIAVASKLHQGDEGAWMKELGITDLVSVNSSLKLCWLAEGKADIYPRLNPTMEWDTGAGEIILQESKCDIRTLPTLAPMPHQQEELRNPGFIAYRSNLRFEATSSLPNLRG